MNFGYTCKKICGGHPSLFTRSSRSILARFEGHQPRPRISPQKSPPRNEGFTGYTNRLSLDDMLQGSLLARRCFTCIRDSSTHGGASTPATLQSQARHRHASTAWMRDWSSRGTHVSVAHTSRSLASFTRESCLSTRARCFARAPA